MQLLEMNGFSNVRGTSASGDHGADILAELHSVKYAIQCKYYSGQVGNHAVQEIFSAKSYYDCDIAVVMTNNTFTDQARQEAHKLGVELWDKHKVRELQPV